MGLLLSPTLFHAIGQTTAETMRSLGQGNALTDLELLGAARSRTRILSLLFGSLLGVRCYGPLALGRSGGPWGRCGGLSCYGLGCSGACRRRRAGLGSSRHRRCRALHGCFTARHWGLDSGCRSTHGRRCRSRRRRAACGRCGSGTSNRSIGRGTTNRTLSTLRRRGATLGRSFFGLDSLFFRGLGTRGPTTNDFGALLLGRLGLTRGLACRLTCGLGGGRLLGTQAALGPVGLANSFCFVF